MSSQDHRNARRTRSQEAAADLLRRGIWHGKRETTSNADPMSYLKPDLVGSAKYQRLMKKAQANRREQS